MNKKAIILLSGGIDSTTVLAMAAEEGYQLCALTFSYGQRHNAEINYAQKIAKEYGVIKHVIFPLDIGQFGGSALTDKNINLPEYTKENINKINTSYVPARNTIFLSIALGLAETSDAQIIFFGGCKEDAAGFPDCRPEYVDAFEKMANLSTRSALEGKKFVIKRPLITLSKAETIQAGIKLGIDYSKTVTCYQANELGEACGSCQSCGVRKQGFINAGIEDVTRYKA